MIETLSYTQYSLALLILITAYTFRGVTGFGSGLISIPLLALFLPLTFVVPFISILDISASAIHVIHTRQHVSWKVILRALPFAVIGVSFGLFIIKSINTLILVKALGAFIILFAIYSLISPTLKKNNSAVWPVFAGFFGSLIGTLFGTGGPFYVFYFHLQQLDKNRISCNLCSCISSRWPYSCHRVYSFRFLHFICFINYCLRFTHYVLRNVCR